MWISSFLLHSPLLKIVIIVSFPWACSTSSSLSPTIFYIRSACLFQTPPTDSLLDYRGVNIHKDASKAVMYFYRLCTGRSKWRVKAVCLCVDAFT